jgi:uncharacterized membrane protein
MLIENRTARILVVSLLVVLVIPLVVMLGMIIFGSSMMAQMGGMQMGSGFMALCVLWTLLVAAALIGLIVLLTRGTGARSHREVPSPNMRSPLPH